jgi:hypothetical protein
MVFWPRSALAALCVVGAVWPAFAGKVGPEFRVNTYTTDIQAGSAVAGLPTGGFVVTWQSYGQDGSDYGVYGQRYDAGGAAVGIEFRANTSTQGAQVDPSVAPLRGGGFVITWQSAGIFAQRYDSTGAAAGPEFQVSGGKHPTTAGLKNGGFVIAWASSPTIQGKRYDGAGAAAGPAFPIGTRVGLKPPTSPAITRLPNGGFVVVWRITDHIKAQRLDATGAPVGKQIAVGVGDSPSITGLGNGFVITYAANGILGRRYDSSGTPVGQAFQVNTSVNSDESNPRVAALTTGGFVVAWGSQHDVFGQVFSKTGQRIGGEFLVNSLSTTNHQPAVPAVAALIGGGFVITWTSWNDQQDGSASGVYGQRFVP